MIPAIPKWLVVKTLSLLMMSNLTTRQLENLVVAGVEALHLMGRVIEVTSKINNKVKLKLSVLRYLELTNFDTQYNYLECNTVITNGVDMIIPKQDISDIIISFYDINEKLITISNDFQIVLYFVLLTK